MTPHEIAARHGLHRSGRSWRGRCPACSYDDAFSVRAGRTGRPLLFCASCQDRDALALAVLGKPATPDPAAAADVAADRARKQAAALRLWAGSEPVTGTIGETYLTARGIGHLATCPDLRFRGDCHHPEAGRLPAVVALVRDAIGQPIGVHRTYLRRDGSGKASVEPNKASLGPIWGGAVRLAPIAAEMVVGEGIETAAAAGLLLGLPAWAAISAGNLATGLALPVGIRAVVVAVDRDPAGEKAAKQAAARWQAEGRHVRLMTPKNPGTDAADILKERGACNA
jgi:phage/plasmid primase-like uncharacterized protein